MGYSFCACFNPAVPGVFRPPTPTCWGSVKGPQPITRESMATARRTRRQAKACNKTLLINTYNFNSKVTGQVKVRSNTQNWTFSSMDFETLCWASFVLKTVRIVQNPSLECYMSVRFRKGSVKHRSGSRSGHKGEVILPIMKVCIHVMSHVFGGGVISVRRIRW